MIKRSVILSLALTLATTLGVGVASMIPANADDGPHCYVPNDEGGFERLDEYEDQSTCEEMTGGTWR